jgi:hypothetical protein
MGRAANEREGSDVRREVGNLRLNHERRVVAQIFTSWNPLTSWLGKIEQFSKAA